MKTYTANNTWYEWHSAVDGLLVRRERLDDLISEMRLRDMISQPDYEDLTSALSFTNKYKYCDGFFTVIKIITLNGL